MGKITIQEPRSVVEEVTKYECDECKAHVDEDEINSMHLYEGPEQDLIQKKADETKHLCESCVGLQHALRVREKKEYLEARWRGFRGKVEKAVLFGFILLGFGMGVGSSLGAGVIGVEDSPEMVTVGMEFFGGTIVFLLAAAIVVVGLALVLPE